MSEKRVAPVISISVEHDYAWTNRIQNRLQRAFYRALISKEPITIDSRVAQARLRRVFKHALWLGWIK